MSTRRLPPAAWLAAGAVLVVAANFRWGIGALAWFAPIPWLYYLRTTRGWRSRAAFAGVAVAAWTVTTLKIVTAPLPVALAPLIGAVAAAFQIAGYLGADALRRRLGDAAAVVLLPALMIVLEWVQPRVTPLATWGAAGYTQLDDLPLLQLASWFGIAAVGFVVWWFAAAGERLLAALIDGAPAAGPARSLAVAIAVIAAAHVYGTLRLDSIGAGTTRVAAIGTIATFGPDTPLTAADRAHILDTLAADTTAAGRAGARLAVWTEGAALATPDEEPALIARAQAIAAAAHVHLVAAYVVPGAPRYQNKYVWVRPDGTIDHVYWKHHPAPGEPSVIGDAPIGAVDSELGRLGGAICYDYDYPSLAATHGALGVDLVALPSSDWRGIDPIHTEMASVRAIEQGVSIVRSTRFGLSAGIDPVGRLRARSSSFDTDQRVLIVDLPRHGVATLYRRVGDVLVLACAGVVLLALGAAIRRRRRAPGTVAV